MEDLAVPVCSVCCMKMVHLFSKLIVTKFNSMNGLGTKNQICFIFKPQEESASVKALEIKLILMKQLQRTTSKLY